MDSRNRSLNHGEEFFQLALFPIIPMVLIRLCVDRRVKVSARFAASFCRAPIQHLSNLASERLGAIGLLNECDTGIKNAMPSNGIVRVTGSEDYFYSGTERGNCGDKFGAAHFRHDDIGQ